MPKRDDIKKVLVIGSGPIIIGARTLNLTMPGPRPAGPSEKKASKLS